MTVADTVFPSISPISAEIIVTYKLSKDYPLAHPARTIAAHESTSVATVFGLMRENNISAIPILATDTQHTWRGVVTSFDILKFAVLDPSLSTIPSGYHTKSDYVDHIFLNPDVLSRPICDVPFRGLLRVSPQEPLSRIVEKMGNEKAVLVGYPSSRPRRVDEIEYEVVLTRLDVVAYVHHALLKSPALSVTIQETDIATWDKMNPLVVAKDSSLAVTILQRMHRHALSAIPIVDDRFKLVGTMSASDLKFIDLDRIYDLKKPVLEFVKGVRGGTTENSHVVLATTTLDTLFHRFLCNNVHQIWVVDKDEVLLGVVTLKDVMAWLKRKFQV